MFVCSTPKKEEEGCTAQKFYPFLRQENSDLFYRTERPCLVFTRRGILFFRVQYRPPEGGWEREGVKWLLFTIGENFIGSSKIQNNFGTIQFNKTLIKKINSEIFCYRKVGLPIPFKAIETCQILLVIVILDI